MDSLSTLARAKAGAATFSLRALLQPPRTTDELWNRLFLALLLIAALLVVLTFRSYGVTWDEDMQRWYGDMVLDHYLSLVGLAKPPNWLALYSYGDLYNYGAVFDMTAGALNRFSPLGAFETRHLLNAIVGLVGVAGAWKLGKRLGGARAGFLAALFLLLTPNYYGQMFNNPKDIPFAAGFIWATYYLVRILPLLPRPPLRLVIKLGVATGLAMAVRVGGLLLVCYLGLMLALFGVWRATAARRLTLLVAIGWTSLWRVFLPVAILSYGVMLLFWPWAQGAPIAHPLSSLAVFSHEIVPTKILFDGQLYDAGTVPWTYLPAYIGLALPELVVMLLLAAPVIAAAALLRRRSWDAARVLPLFMLGFTIVFPVAYAIADNVVLFNGMRHFIFVLPPIAVAAALVADTALQRLGGLPYRKPVYAALGLYGLAHVSVMVMLHPDQYVYYNGFVGGVAGAEHKFKLDYWANSYAEAVRGLENYLRKQYGADFEEREFTVAVEGPPVSARYYFPSNFRQVVQPERADFVIGFTLDEAEHYLSDLPVYKVKRMGALLSIVVDHREFLAEQRIAHQPLAGATRRAPAFPY
ncbi:MAG TPA: glycosyltransferase family 39 protein [Stellaceae bacterium]|nr:glycosyltransferase family 39 protein [Stellaceae bacterium]